MGQCRFKAPQQCGTGALAARRWFDREQFDDAATDAVDNAYDAHAETEQPVAVAIAGKQAGRALIRVLPDLLGQQLEREDIMRRGVIPQTQYGW